MSRPYRRRKSIIGILFVAAMGIQECSAAFCQESTHQDISSLSLEQLTTMEVSSVARREEQLFTTPSAVFVITQEDIQNSGASSVPELLRIVPGVQVAQVKANTWAISARGFNGIFADKMLVMIDGRTIYTTIYSGTFWDQNEVMLENIERIEVIRGPGATMWGANAVNGVINIITKKAKDTVGSQLVAIGGRLERGGSARFGAEHGEKFQYNLFFYDLRRPSLVSSVGNVGGNADDAGTSIRGGGRADWQASKRDWVSVNGDMYRNREDQRVYQINAPSPQTEVIVEGKVQGSGGYGLMRWEHRADVSDFAIQVYYNDQNRAESKGMGREGTTDVDFQAHVPAGSRNDVTWGLGFRYNGDHIHGTPLPFFHSTHEINLFSSFVQDELSMVPDKLILTVGSKLQWNSYTHLEVQPSGRLLWTPDARHSVWTSVARAVKTPSIRERDLFTTFPEPTSLPFPTEILISGNPAIRSEVALSYEGGYRQQFAKRLSVDLAGFATHYSRLVASRPQQPYVSLSSGPMLIVPILYSNGMKANAQGLEASVSWSPVATVHFASSYAWMQARIAQSESLSTFGADTLGLNWSTPRNTINVRGAWNVTGHWTVNASVDSVSTTPIYDAGSSLPPQPVPAYRRVDLGVAYVLREHAIFRAGVHNLQSAQHIEFNPQDNYDVPSEVPRSAFAKIVWSF